MAGMGVTGPSKDWEAEVYIDASAFRYGFLETSYVDAWEEHKEL